MQRPDLPFSLYVDHDSFYGAVAQYLNPSARGRPVGIVPFEGAGAVSIIASSKEAKARGVKGAMRVRDAKILCPDILLLPSTPALYRRAQQASLATVELHCKIEAVLSIDEAACRLDRRQASEPMKVIEGIKRDIRDLFDGVVSVSVGVAPSRLLAKIAADRFKPDGAAVIWPQDIPGCLYDIPLKDVPGIGRGTLARLVKAGISDMEDLLKADRNQVRKIVGGVHGARMLMALQGYDVHSGSTSKKMMGHGKVLGPADRKPKAAREIAKVLAIKAGRKLRAAGFAAGRLIVSLNQLYVHSSGSAWIPAANDEPALMAAFEEAWREAERAITEYALIMSLNVCFVELSRIAERQLDWILDDELERRKAEDVTAAIDGLNRKFGTTVVSFGPWRQSDRLGNSIAYGSIPRPEAGW